MTVITTDLMIGNVNYTFRLPIGRIIALERYTGKSVTELNHDMEGLSNLIRFAIQKDGKYLTKEEVDDLFDNITADEFTQCVNAVVSVMNAGKANTGKNQ